MCTIAPSVFSCVDFCLSPVVFVNAAKCTYLNIIFCDQIQGKSFDYPRQSQFILSTVFKHFIMHWFSLEK